MSTQKLLKNRSIFEEKLRNLIGRPILLIELDMFALPCGCSGITANTRGLEIDDLEVFDQQLLPYLKEMADNFEIRPNIIFARLVPGSSVVASINWRILCSRCYPEFARHSGKTPRPDIYILKFEKR